MVYVWLLAKKATYKGLALVYFLTNHLWRALDLDRPNHLAVHCLFWKSKYTLENCNFRQSIIKTHNHNFGQSEWTIKTYVSGMVRWTIVQMDGPKLRLASGPLHTPLLNLVVRLVWWQIRQGHPARDQLFSALLEENA